MSRLHIIISRAAMLFRRKQLNHDLEAELRAHLDMLAEENVRRGMEPQEARYAALRSFGGVEQVKESYREQGRFVMVETLKQDVRYGLRQLRCNPGFSLI